MNIQITLNAPELSAAINNLANALGKSEGLHTGQAMQAIAASAEQFVEQQQTQQAPPQQQQDVTGPGNQQQPPVQQPAPSAVPTASPAQQTPPPAQQPPVQQGAVPTSEAKYTMQQLAVAATQLMDAGKGNEVHRILGEFQVQTLTMLPEEQYGAFATKLREAGASI